MKRIDYSSKEFLKICDGLITKSDYNISQFLKQYEPNIIMEKSIIFNGIVSDVSNTIFDFQFGKDEDEYYQIPVINPEFKRLFYKKYSRTNRRYSDRVYHGIYNLDLTLHVDVNYLGLFEEIFSLKKFTHTLPEIALFSWFIRPASDSLPFFIKNYCKGDDQVSNDDYQVVLINLILMFTSPLISIYSHKISSILDPENKVRITYDDKNNEVYFEILNQYSGLDPSGIGNIYGMKPFRISPEYMYNQQNMEPLQNPSFFSIKEFEMSVDNQFKAFKQFINDIEGIPLDVLNKYVKFLIAKIGNNSFVKYSNKSVLIRDVEKGCNFEKKLSEKLIDISTSQQSNVLNSFFFQKPILRSNYKYYIMAYHIPRWTLILLDSYADPIKSYQIKMGYEFEEEVKKIMKSYGIDIIKVRRIEDTKDSDYNNREFDVITNFGNEIYGFQCKNYKFDYFPKPSKIGELKKRHDNVLRRVKKGLKEEDYKRKLLEKTYKKNVQIYAISRFPLVTTNPRIISFNKLNDWLKTRIE